MPDGNAALFRVIDLKQYLYCPRILYYHTCLPDIRPETYKMVAGIEAHEEEQRRATRRSLKALSIGEGIRHFDVAIASVKLGLTAQIDEVIEVASPSPALIPIDYKLSKTAAFHFKVQLAAYAMLLEEQWAKPARQGYLYLIPTKQYVNISINTALREPVQHALREMNRITYEETMPPPTGWAQRCVSCEFRRFCNDVI